jgi:hypothetical protein
MNYQASTLSISKYLSFFSIKNELKNKKYLETEGVTLFAEERNYCKNGIQVING